MPPERFLTRTLRACPHGERAARVLAAAIQAVDPAAAVARHLRREEDHLRVAGRAYRTFERVFLVGGGKAGAPMGRAAVEILGEKLAGGVLITKHGHAGGAARIGPVALLEAGHPLPDASGVAATRRMIDLLARTTPQDLVVCLISGGGSALMTQPVPGVSLADLRTLTDQLLACGATINEINTLRKHLDQVKGGGLARFAAPAAVITLILSDVVGNPLDVIASGPTVPDLGTFADAVGVLQKYALWQAVPAGIRQHLARGAAGEVPETPKPGDPIFARVQNVLVGSNELAAQAAVQQAEQEGWRARILTTSLTGEAREAGQWLAQTARQAAERGEPLPPPACLIVGGETTVTLGASLAEVGKGGRNQEMALAAVPGLAGVAETLLVTLATDGGDGPTDAAGAVVSGHTLARAQAAGLDPGDFLARHDAYHFFDPLGDLLRPGPTQTNVNDLAFVFLGVP